MSKSENPITRAPAAVVGSPPLCHSISFGCKDGRSGDVAEKAYCCDHVGRHSYADQYANKWIDDEVYALLQCIARLLGAFFDFGNCHFFCEV